MNVLIVSSVHDYRMARRGSIQSIADGLAKAGARVSFLSIRFSYLSLLRRDPRSFLWRRANRVERHNGIDCFAWRTVLHPASTGSPRIDRLLGFAYRAYAAIPNRPMDSLIAGAEVIILESGHSIALLRRIRRLNPGALVLYRASDRLDVIGAGSALQAILRGSEDAVDGYLLIADKLRRDFTWAGPKVHVLPLGIDRKLYDRPWPSPFAPGERAAVSVGAMLFDAEAIRMAAAERPDVTFYVIGSGTAARDFPANVRLLDEMSFIDTLPYVCNATIGFAPYRQVDGTEYLQQSSLKLLQFSHLGIPVVCPQFASGPVAGRFGYRPGDGRSIKAALDGALAAGRVPRMPVPDWDEIVTRLLAIMAESGRFPPAAQAHGDLRAMARG